MNIQEFKEQYAAVYASLAQQSQLLNASGLELSLIELVKIRASQLNGCAFCVNFHLGLARKYEVSQAKLDMLPVWHEADVFSARERAALAWCEALTQAKIEPQSRALLLPHFSESEQVYLSLVVGLINQWNRIAIGLGFPQG